MNPYLNRMLRAAKLEAGLYEEVEHDPSAMGQAIGVVVLSSIASGIGAAAAGVGQGLILGIATSLIGWFIWAGLTYVIGTRLLPTPQTEADYGQLLRTIGFSTSPGLIRVLGIIPGLNELVAIVTTVWMLLAMVIAVRQALDYTSTLRAMGVCIIGWIVYSVILILFFIMIGGVNP
jgi:hypothetical protein